MGPVLVNITGWCNDQLCLPPGYHQYFVFVCILHNVVLVYCEYGGMDLMGLKPSPWDPSSFSAVTLLVGSFDL